MMTSNLKLGRAKGNNRNFVIEQILCRKISVSLQNKYETDRLNHERNTSLGFLKQANGKNSKMLEN